MTNKRILFTDTKFSIAKNETTGVTTLTGYAIVWNAVSTDRGGYFVRLLPGSANPTANTYALVNHDYNMVLAMTDDKSLRMSSDATGVKVEIDMPDTSYGRDYTWLVANGKVSGMSFAMIPNANMAFKESDESGSTILNFSKFDFDEITITPRPAFTETSLEVAKTPDGNSMQLADNKEKETFTASEDFEKDLDEAVSKNEIYRLNMYPTSMAEFQATDTESDNLELTNDKRIKE